MKNPRFAVVALVCLVSIVGWQWLPAKASQAGWTQLFPSPGASPPVRDFGASVIGDGSGNLILFGGRTSGGTSYNDAWAMHGTAYWYQLFISGTPPSPRFNAATAYDRFNNRLIVFGGCAGACLPAANDVWVLTNANGRQPGLSVWMPLTTSGTPPSPRHAALAAYDEGTNRLIVFGGHNGGGSFGGTFTDVWVLSNANGFGGTPQWTQLVAGGAHPGGYFASGGYDSATDELIVTGGFNSSGVKTNAVHVLRNTRGSASWVNTVAEGAAGSPPPFSSAGSAYDSQRHRLLITSPNSAADTHDVWTLADGITWTRYEMPSGPLASAAVQGIGFEPYSTVVAGFFAGPAGTNAAWTVPINRAPQFLAPTPAEGSTITVRQGQRVSFEIAAEDPDEWDSVYIDAGPLPAYSTFPHASPANPISRVFEWDTSNFAGTHDFTFTATDTDGLFASSTRRFTVVVTPDSYPYYVSPPSPLTPFRVTTGMPISFTVQAADPDPGDVAFLTVDYDTLPPGAVVTGGGAQPFQFNWTPGPNQVGYFGTMFKVVDEAGIALFLPVAMTVVQNQPPQWLEFDGVNMPVIAATVGTPVSFFAHVRDLDIGHVVTPMVDFSTMPPGATAVPGPPYDATWVEFNWTPGSSALGHHVIRFTGSDQYGASSEFTFDVFVQPPTLVSIAVSPSTATKHIGQGQHFTATGTFSDGSTQMLPSGPPLNPNPGGSPLWQTFFSPAINVSACSTAEYPNMVSFASQVFGDYGGNVDETWSPMTPVLDVTGSINTFQVSLTLACTNGNAAGTITAAWDGTRYEGTYTLGAASGQVSIRGWSTKAPMQTGRHSFGAAQLDGAIHVIGGASGNTLLDTVESYQPFYDSWSPGATMPTPREGLGVGTIGNLLYAVGGNVAGGLPSGIVERYDVVGYHWSPIMSSMATARAHFATAVAGGKLYVFGGDVNSSNTGQLSSVEVFNPVDNLWTTLAPMPTARSYAVAGVIDNGKIVVAGGSTPAGNTAVTEIYDIATDTWTTGVPMPQPRAAHAGGVTNGGLFIFGGTTNGFPNADTLVYYPAGVNQQEGWATLGSMPVPRSELSAVVIGDVVYGIGGQDTNPIQILRGRALTALSTPLPGHLTVGYTTSPGLPTVQWSSTNQAVAAIDPSGNASTLAAGQTTIVATAGSISCQTTNTCASLTVTNAAPTVSINGGPFTINEGQNQFMNATANDADGDPLTYFWEVISGPGSFSNPGNFSQNFQGPNGPSDSTIRLTVTDSHGASASAQTTVHVNNVTPSVSIFGGSSLMEGTTYSAGGSFNDPGADTWIATVNYGDGSGAQPLSFTGTGNTKNFNLSHFYASYGTYTVTVTVSDGGLAPGTQTRLLTVNNQPPFVFIGGSSSQELIPGQTLTRNGGFSDPGVNPWTATVNYGDGGGTQPLPLTGKTFTLSHAYTHAGDYQVTVTVSDGMATRSANLNVTVVSVPAFSLPVAIPPGECVCTPLARVGGSAVHTWYVKANGGPLTATLVAVADHQGTPHTVQSRVTDLAGNILAQTMVSLAAGLPDNTQARSAMTLPSTTPGAVYRVQAAAPASTGNTARYFLRFDGAMEAAASSPSPAIEGGFTSFLFNVDAADALGVMVSTQGLFQPPAGTTTLEYQWIAPDGTASPVQSIPVTLPGPPAAVNQVVPPPAAVSPGVWRLRVHFEYDYVIGKVTGSDDGVYADHLSGGRGAIQINVVDAHGNPFTGTVGIVGSFGPHAFTSFDVTGSLFVDAAEAFTYQLAVTPPAGYTALTPSIDLLVACDKTSTITIVIADTTPPVMSGVPANITAQATSSAGAVVSYALPTATDAIDGPRPVACAPPSGSTFPSATTAVTCTATDASGNTVNGSFTVTVTPDTAPPVMSGVPANITVPAPTAAGAIVDYALPTATDAVNGPLPVTCAPPSGSTFPVATTTVTCTATDASANTVTRSFTVTVTSSAPPSSPDGYMHGGGHLDNGNKHHHFTFRAWQRGNLDKARLEYWVVTPQRRNGRHDCDDDGYHDDDGDRDNHYGRDRKHAVNSFQATTITSVTFADDADFRPGRSWRGTPTVDTVTIVGKGKWNGRGGYTFVAVATDQGEPGRGHDTFAITVKDSRGNVVATVDDTLDGGNIQSTRLTPRRW